MAKTKIAKVIGEIFTEELDGVVIQEQEVDEFLNRKDFEDASERAATGIEIAMKRPRKILSLAVALHEGYDHGAQRAKEVEYLKENMSAADVEIASELSSWWSKD